VLRLAREAMKKGGALPCALNAPMKWRWRLFWREASVLGIPEVIEKVLARMPKTRFEKMDDVLTADSEARRMARKK